MPNAIVSVYDKTQLDRLGSLLSRLGFTVYATPGTRRALRAMGYDPRPVEQISGNPAGFEDFVSSFGFNTMIAALAKDRQWLVQHGICPVEVVVYDFVPSWELVTSLDGFDITSVDFGGPAMVKAAALNFARVIPIVSASQYGLLERYPDIDIRTRCALAQTALRACAAYDSKLAELLRSLADKTCHNG